MYPCLSGQVGRQGAYKGTSHPDGRRDVTNFDDLCDENNSNNNNHDNHSNYKKKNNKRNNGAPQPRTTPTTNGRRGSSNREVRMTMASRLPFVRARRQQQQQQHACDG